jgi:hypothetical protein
MKPIYRLAAMKLFGLIINLPILVLVFFDGFGFHPNNHTMWAFFSVATVFGSIAIFNLPASVFDNLERFGIQRKSARCLFAMAALFSTSIAISEQGPIGYAVAMIFLFIGVALVFLATIFTLFPSDDDNTNNVFSK